MHTSLKLVLSCSLSELVQHGVNGLVFENSKQLSSHLQKWFQDYRPGKQWEEAKRFRKNIAKFQQLDWHKNWEKNALKLFR